MQSDDYEFRCPSTLGRTPGSTGRMLTVGSCLSEVFGIQLSSVTQMERDFILINQVRWHKAQPPRPLQDYAFMLVNVPFQLVIQDSELFALHRASPSEARALFSRALRQMLGLLHCTLQWTKASGIPTLVSNFIVPQQPEAGRLSGERNSQHLRYIVDRLNKRLAREVFHCPGACLLDIDAIASSIGKRFVSDDHLRASHHNAFQTDYDYYRGVEPAGQPSADSRLTVPLSSIHPSRTNFFLRSVAHEIQALRRSFEQLDAVRLVVTDLDETLWDGVPAETDLPPEMSGLTLGLLEALAILRRRGILLGIVSRTDPARLEQIWEKSVSSLMSLSDFTFVKTGWGPKSQSLEAILQESGCSPSQTLFIDGDPRERAAIQAAFPATRVLGEQLYDLRRILLWSPETQPVHSSAESARRHQLTAEKITRDDFRSHCDQETFLRELNLKVALRTITSVNAPEFPRVLELIHRTNQFNTTGERPARHQMEHFFHNGGTCLAAVAEDRFSHYGLIAVALSRGHHVEQLVVSCRTIGLGIEAALLRELQQQSPETPLSISIHPNERNQAARDSIERFSGQSAAVRKTLILPVLQRPAHIELSQDVGNTRD